MQQYGFGIDLGGTTAKLGLFTTDGSLLDKWEIPTDASGHGARILPALANTVKQKMDSCSISPEQVLGIGLGVPGAVGADHILAPCTNLDSWGGFDVEKALSDLLFHLPVHAANDANLAGLGEAWKGAGQGCRSLLMVTLGTGIGGCIIVNGRIYPGAHGAAGEIGHIKVNPAETEFCGCGKRGCLEQYCSASGLIHQMHLRLAREPAPSALRGMQFAAREIFDAAKSGDALALAQVSEMSYMLGRAIAGLTATLDPEAVLLGGGVSRAGDILVKAVEKACVENAFPPCAGIPIRLATLGNDAGIYGAMKLMLDECCPCA